MTGRELIMYILENHLEDEPVFQNGTFIGYVSDVKFAEMLGVGVSTVHTWILLGRMKDTIMIGDSMFVPMFYVDELQKQKEIVCCLDDSPDTKTSHNRRYSG